MQYVTLQEADWRKRQIERLHKQFKRYQEVASAILLDLNKAESNFIITVYLVHRTFVKAWTQYGLAINVGDREATQQANHFIKLLTDWFNEVNTTENRIKNDWGKIRDMVTNPKLIYYETIRK